MLVGVEANERLVVDAVANSLKFSRGFAGARARADLSPAAEIYIGFWNCFNSEDKAEKSGR